MDTEGELLIDNRELLQGFREGNRRTLDRVFRHYAPMVVRLLRSGFMYSTNGHPTRFPGLRSSYEVEEVLQEVFKRALAPRARVAYDGLRPYAGFLIGVARNVVLDELRRKARRGEVLEATDAIEMRVAVGAVAQAPDPASEIPEDIDQRRSRTLVATFMAEQCDERDRRLYELRYGEGLSQQVSAKQSGLTRIQVRRWETKFRVRLLRFLKRANYVRGG